MAHGRLSLRPVEALSLSLGGNMVGTRPRSDWVPDSRLSEGPAYGLLHGASPVDGIADGRVSVDLSVRNLLDTSFATLVPIEDANALNSDGTAKYPTDLEGEGRNIQVGVDIGF